MIRTIYRHRSGTIVIDLPQDQLLTAVKDPQSRIWIDMVAPTADEYTLVLDTVFHFHPLAIEDAINEVHVPKVDDYGTYLYLVVHTFTLGDERMDIDTHELDVFLGSHYLVTIHETPRPSIEKMWQEEYHCEHGLARGAALLLYEVLDRQIDGYIPLLELFEEKVEALGDAIVRKTMENQEQLLNDILTAKSSALRLRRILLPQREVMLRLARNSYSVIPAEARLYYQDLYDHLVRLADLAESMRDLVSSTMETHLAMANNRLNEVMKVLTIISTIFMPLSFVAGVYGMNFRYLPELDYPWAYPLVWLLFIAIAGGMLIMFRRRHWL